MAIYNRKGLSNPFSDIAAQVTSAVASNAFDAVTPGMANTMFESASLESASTMHQNLALAESQVEAWLRSEEVALDVAVANHLGLESVDHPCVVNAIDAACQTIIASGNQKAYTEKLYSHKEDNIRNLSGPLDSRTFSMESFDNFQFDDYIGSTVVANALAAASTPAEELFFRTILCTGAQGGAMVDIRNPQIYTRSLRNANGTAYNLAKQSVTRAYIDHTILENQNSTKIVPIVKASDANAGVLVAATDVPTKTYTVAGEEVSVRPFKYGVKVDLISNSVRPGQVGGSTTDETYTLDPISKLGWQYIKVTNGTNTDAFRVNVDNIAGSLLNPPTEGESRTYTTVLDGFVTVSNETTLLSDDETTLEDKFGIAVALGLTAGTEWKLKLDIRMSGSLDLIASNMQVDFSSATIVGAESAGVAITDLSGLNSVLLSGYGFWPSATKTNSNMHELGTIVDMSDVTKLRLPARMQAPLSLITPVSAEGGTATIDAVQMVKSVTTSNRAVTRIFEAGEYIESSATALVGSPSLGVSAGIVPTCIRRTLAAEDTIIFGSSQALSDLRGQITAAASVLVLEMLQNSGYRTSLKTFTSSVANFEVIGITDERIHSLMMIEGDPRTIGNGINFRLEYHPDARFYNKIVFSVRRTNATNVEPHSFGFRPMRPSLIHSAVVTRSGTGNETILVPCEDHYVTCPVMAFLTITGLDTMFAG